MMGKLLTTNVYESDVVGRGKSCLRWLEGIKKVYNAGRLGGRICMKLHQAYFWLETMFEWTHPLRVSATYKLYTTQAISCFNVNPV